MLPVVKCPGPDSTELKEKYVFRLRVLIGSRTRGEEPSFRDKMITYEVFNFVFTVSYGMGIKFICSLMGWVTPPPRPLPSLGYVLR